MLARMLPAQMGRGLGARPSLDLRAQCSFLDADMLQAELQATRVPLMECVEKHACTGGVDRWRGCRPDDCDDR